MGLSGNKASSSEHEEDNINSQLNSPSKDDVMAAR